MVVGEGWWWWWWLWLWWWCRCRCPSLPPAASTSLSRIRMSSLFPVFAFLSQNRPRWCSKFRPVFKSVFFTSFSVLFRSFSDRVHPIFRSYFNPFPISFFCASFFDSVSNCFFSVVFYLILIFAFVFVCLPCLRRSRPRTNTTTVCPSWGPSTKAATGPTRSACSPASSPRPRYKLDLAVLGPRYS